MTPDNYSPTAGLLKEKTILVTGAADGIGRAASLAYAQHGATVILLDRDIPKLETIYDEIEALQQSPAAIYPLNLEKAEPQHYEELVATIEREFGTLDGLLHNAAKLGTLGPTESQDIKTWYEVFQVNLNGPFLLTRACLPLIRTSKDASIIFTSDKKARPGTAFWGAYGASKSALDGLAATLADELENTATIRVNTIVPCPTRTTLRAKAYPGEDPNTLPEPAAITNAYVYLMGSDSADVHGEIIEATE